MVGLLEDAAGGSLDGVKVDLKNKIAVESKTGADVVGENKNLKTGLWKMKLWLVWNEITKNRAVEDEAGGEKE